MAYVLGEKLRIETEMALGRLLTRAFLGERELLLEPALVGALFAMTTGAQVGAAQLAALLKSGVLREEAPPPPLPQTAGWLCLRPTVAIEPEPAQRFVRGRPVAPDNSLPIGLFVPPEKLVLLTDLADSLRHAWFRLLSAAQSRGRLVDPTAARDILIRLCRQELADQPALRALFQIHEEPFRLVPHAALQAEVVQYPIGELRFFAQREPSPEQRPLRFRPGADVPFAQCGRLLGQLACGLSAERWTAEVAAAPPSLRQLAQALAAADLIVAPPAPRPFELLPGVVAHLGHATLLANLGGAYVLIDPWLPATRAGDVLKPLSLPELPPLAAVLLTHHHWDHVHLETLLRMDKRTVIYTPKADPGRPLVPCTERLLMYLGFTDVRPLGHGETIAVGTGGEVVAVPFFGEDPTRLGYSGNCYLLRQGGAAALVHVDSGTDWQGRSVVTTGVAQALVAKYGPLRAVFATRRQERGTMIEHPWEFLLRPADEWTQPAENCCNDAAFLAALCEQTKAQLLVLYSEGGADFYPKGTDFLRRATATARMAPYEYLWDTLEQITAQVTAVGTAVRLSIPFEQISL